MAKLYSSVHFYGQRRKRNPQSPIQIGDKFGRLTVIEIQPQKKGSGAPAGIVCRCECSHRVKTNAASLRKGYVSACPSCAALEKKSAQAIAAAKEVERLTSPHVDSSELPKREPWEWAGKEDELISGQEKQDASK